MDFKKLFKDEAYGWMYKTLALGLAAVIIFTAGVYSTSLFTASTKTVAVQNQNVQSNAAPSDSSAGTEQKSPQSSTSSKPPVTITDENKTEMTTAEIIELFNTSANKVKQEAVTVTKNYEYRKYLEENSKVPDKLKGLANSLMSTAFKDDTEPIVYATKDEIIANYQVPGQTWSSTLTEAEVEEALCADNGGEYEIYLKLKSSVNPENATGVAKAFDTITTSEVRENAPAMIKDFSTEYFNCEIRCKIDKESGRMTWSNYTSPVIMKVNVEFFGTIAAEVALSFEKDYTITY
ncbi:MAG: hypothetical protein IKJ27_09215 [Clostridia bacterium]|nr:hypothetical protein [Clostridia bacterium]